MLMILEVFSFVHVIRLGGNRAEEGGGMIMGGSGLGGVQWSCLTVLMMKYNHDDNLDAYGELFTLPHHLKKKMLNINDNLYIPCRFLASPATRDSSGCSSEANPTVETTGKGEIGFFISKTSKM